MNRTRAATAVGLAVLLSYICTLAPELTPRRRPGAQLAFQITDSPTVQQALTVAGSVDDASPSALLTRAWARLPATWNLNFLSAILAALATGLLAAHLMEPAGTLAGASAALAFGLSPLVWATAVAAAGSTATLTLLVAALVLARTATVWLRTGRAWLGIAGACALVVTTAEAPLAGLIAALFVSGLVIQGGGRRRSWLSCGGAALALGAFWYWAGTGREPLPGLARMQVTEAFGAVAGAIGVLGCVLAALGLRRSLPMLAMLALAIGALSAGPMPAAHDPATRLVLLLAIAWTSIALGLQRLSTWHAAEGRPVAVMLGLLLPLLQLGSVFSQANGLIDPPAGRMIEAFSRQHTGPAAIVTDDAETGRLWRWVNQRRGREARFSIVPHDAARISALIERGEQVFAAPPAAARLSLAGITGPAVAVDGRPLEDVLGAIDRRALVAFATGPGTIGDGSDAVAIARVADRPAAALAGAVVLLARRSESAAHVITGDAEAELDVAPGDARGISPVLIPDAGVRLEAGPAGTRLAVAGREVAFAERGGLLAAWSPLDAHLEWFALDPARGLSTAWRHERWDLSRLDRVAPCTTLGAESWVDIMGAATAARIGLQVPRGGTLRMYFGRDRRLHVRGAAFPLRPPAAVSVVEWDAADAVQAGSAAEAMSRDGIAPPLPAGARFVWQVTVQGSAASADLLSLGLGGRPDWARAKLLGGGSPPATATACPGVAGARLFTRDGQREEAVSLGDEDSYGAGWGRLTRSGADRWRETSAAESELVVRLDARRPLVLAVSARPAPPGRGGTGQVAVEVNGQVMEAQPLREDIARYTWTVPDTHWRTGTNRIVLRVTSGTETTGDVVPALQVFDVRFRR